jgi:hypothetical protein
MEELAIHMNPKQIEAWVVDAKTTLLQWGRGTGKTFYIGYWTSHRAHVMPRSGGSIIAPTYTQILTKLAPSIIAAWDAMGLVENVHYFYNKFPPKNYRVPKAYSSILSPKYTVTFWNGSWIQFLSADRGIANGLSTDYQAFDECKMIKYDKFREISLTARGNTSHFGGNYYHGSSLLTTDAPRDPSGQWFKDFEKKMDIQMIQLITEISLTILQLKEEQKKSKSKRSIIKAEKEIQHYNTILNKSREEAIFYSKASTIDNIHAIGPDQIFKYRRDMPSSEYKISVLNMDDVLMSNSFYSTLNADEHGYYGENVAFIEALGVEVGDRNIVKDCRWKSPKHYNKELPLDIGMDYNSAINCLAVGQGNIKKYRLLNSFFVLEEKGKHLADVVKVFCEFYKHHRNKTVNYYYDHTAIGKDSTGRKVFFKVVEQGLKAEGWIVKKHRMPSASTHMARYQFWLDLLDKENKSLPQFFFDLDDAKQWQTSAEGTGVKFLENGFKKDKSSETRRNANKTLVVRPENSTHMGEAVDGLLFGKFGKSFTRTGNREHIRASHSKG